MASGLSSGLRSIARPEDADGGPVVALGQVLIALFAVGLYEVAHVLDGDRRSVALSHARSVLHFERFIHVDWERFVQAHMVHQSVLRVLANTVYAWTYWPVVLGALVFLWSRDRRRFAILRDAMVLAGAVGLAVFVAFPVAPPRMLPGFFNTISRSSAAYQVVHGSIADPFAALPSFHAGWVAIAAVVAALAATHRRIALPVATAVAAGMTIAVVATANHYVVDAVSGIVLCALTGVVASRLHPSKPSGGDAPTVKAGVLHLDRCA